MSTPTRTSTPSSPSTRVISSETSGSSLVRIRSAVSSRVTRTPNRTKTWESSQPIGPAPTTAIDSGRSVTFTTSRLVQYGVSASPSIGGAPGAVPVAEQHALGGGVRGAVDLDLRAAGESRLAVQHRGAGLLQPLDRGRVVPVVGAAGDPGGHRGPVGVDVAVPRDARGLQGGGDRRGAAQHDLAGDAAVERALAADEVLVDREDPQPGPRQLDARELAAGPEPDHDHVVGVCHGPTLPDRAQPPRAGTLRGAGCRGRAGRRRGRR